MPKFLDVTDKAAARAALGAQSDLGQIPVTDFGAVGDAVALTDAAMTAGSAVCTSASSPFTAAMVGKTIVIQAGTGQALMATTVASYQNAGQITLATPAITNARMGGGPNINAVIGTDNSAAFAAAFSAAAAGAAAAGIRERYQDVPPVYVPSGTYLTLTGVPALQVAGHSLVGFGQNSTRIWHVGSDPFLQMGVFNASPDHAWYGSKYRLTVSNLTLAEPTGKSRIGCGIQDNGSGELLLSNALIFGFEYGFYGTSGSDFTRIGPNVTFQYCDVGMYFGPGSQQVLLYGVDTSWCEEGLVNEGAPQGALVMCSFENNSIADITYDGKSSGTTRAGLPYNVAGSAYEGSWTHTGCWFESGAGGVYTTNNDHHIWIKSVGSANGWRGLAFRDCFLISGGTQVPEATNAFIGDAGTKSANPVIDNLTAAGRYINGVYYYYYGPAASSGAVLRDCVITQTDGTIIPFVGGTVNSSLSTPLSDLIRSDSTLTLSNAVLSGCTAANGAVVDLNSSQTLTNKVLTSPKVNTITDTNGASSLVIGATASAVNYLTLTNGAAGSGGEAGRGQVQLIANGSDTNVNIAMRPKSGGWIDVNSGNGLNIARFQGTTSDANYWRFEAAPNGGAIKATAAAAGGDANVSINLVPRGSGTLQQGGVPVSTNSTTATHTAQQIELGHATDTTIARSAAGVATVEGNPVSVRVTVPGTSTTAGKPGYWAADASFIYSYTGDGSTHTWVRATAASW